MISRIAIQLSLLAGGIASAAQGDRGGLARLLADQSTRQVTVDSLVNSTDHRAAVLLSLAQTPPPGVNKYALDVGLAETFGRLRTKEAIPFLISNITLQFGGAGPDLLSRDADSIKSGMPAVAALIQIGPEASRALIRAVWKMHDRDRIAAIFVISQSRSVPEARDALHQIMGQTNVERYWAQQGLDRMDRDQ
jgi:hypothetical protein